MQQVPIRSRGAIVFIFITLLLDSIGFGLIGPVMPQLIEHLTGESAAKGVEYAGWLYFVYAITQFFCAPILGNLSDRFGRRPVLLASLCALGIDYLVMALAPNMSWLFLGRFIAGIAGATYTPAYAFIADVSPPEKRAQNFGLMGAAFGAGFIIGPTLGGVLGVYGERLPFYAAAAMGLLNFVLGCFVLPETLSRDLRRKFEWRRANPVGALMHLRSYPLIGSLLGAAFLWQLAHQSLPATYSFYAVLKFQWTPAQIGYSLAFAGLIMILGQGWLTPILVKRLGGERRAIVAGFVAGSLTYFGYAFASQGWMVYAFLTFWLFAGVAWPSLNALLSRQVPASAQGELQGGMGSIGSLAAIVGPPVLSQCLGYFTSDGAPVRFAGAAFALAGVLALGALAMLTGALRRGASVPLTSES
jgi:DHA1 family tetracycline resistance protein-like MFS transporter